MNGNNLYWYKLYMLVYQLNDGYLALKMKALIKFVNIKDNKSDILYN